MRSSRLSADSELTMTVMRVLPYVAFVVGAAVVVGYLGPPGLVLVGVFLLAGLTSAAILFRARH